MYLKRFRSATVRDGLRTVRDELGPHALVLSTAMVPVRGWRGLFGVREVEIAAAAEREVSPERPSESSDRHPSAPDPAAADVAARLAAAGVDRALAAEIANSMSLGNRRGASARSLSAALADRLSWLAATGDEYARAEVFIGPAGAGKTTTIAKIAAQERARTGRRLGLLAADGFRLGAIEQLRMYAQVVGAPFRVASTAADLEAELAELRGGPILVDTAGRAPTDADARELFRVVAAGHGHGVRTHLVLPAGTPVASAKRIFDAYAEARPSRVVLTKLDEIESCSPLIGLLRDRELPVSYLGTGQRIPEDLNRATGRLLASSVLGEPAALFSTAS